ncbi:hypothetical protein EIK77_008022 [Talaromyces pinophilus]|nr:hypothetical protein EIK77_008022 [Talaromyces pinophilus]PCH06636.1 hypothetical protein PENOC_022720 [Penicillium occitanis (nom. inval.)]
MMLFPCCKIHIRETPGRFFGVVNPHQLNLFQSAHTQALTPGIGPTESIYQDTTFPETVGSQDLAETAMVLTSQFKDAILESARKSDEREQPDYESESEKKARTRWMLTRWMPSDVSNG